MFSLSVIEHLRLNCDLIVRNHAVHAQAAERLAAVALRAKMATLGLLALSAGTIVLSLFRPAREYQITAAVLAGVALIVHAGVAAYGADARVHAHRLLAHRLWMLCERYRELLTEIQDGLVDTAAVLRRRELLSEQVHASYAHGFPADQKAYESLRLLPFESGDETATGAHLEDHAAPTRRAG